MAAGNSRNIVIKSLLTIVSLVVAYFSVVSTITINRVGSIEQKVNHRAEEISRNERNIAVLLEKVTTVERLVREIRQEMTKLAVGRAQGAAGPPWESE